MKMKKDWRCWEITGCGQHENCRAGRQEEADRQCWDLASELDDYRSALNVCGDCIVYVTKQGTSALTAEEVQEILLRKEQDCFLARSCPMQATG